MAVLLARCSACLTLRQARDSTHFTMFPTCNAKSQTTCDSDNNATRRTYDSDDISLVNVGRLRFGCESQLIIFFNLRFGFRKVVHTNSCSQEVFTRYHHVEPAQDQRPSETPQQVDIIYGQSRCDGTELNEYVEETTAHHRKIRQETTSRKTNVAQREMITSVLP